MPIGVAVFSIVVLWVAWKCFRAIYIEALYARVRYVTHTIPERKRLCAECFARVAHSRVLLDNRIALHDKYPSPEVRNDMHHFLREHRVWCARYEELILRDPDTSLYIGALLLYERGKLTRLPTLPYRRENP